MRHSIRVAPEPSTPTIFCGSCRQWIASNEPPQVLGRHPVWLCAECRPEGQESGYGGAAEPPDGAKFSPNTEIATTRKSPSEIHTKSPTSDTGFAPLAVAASRARQRGRPATGMSRWARRRHRLARAVRAGSLRISLPAVFL